MVALPIAGAVMNLAGGAYGAYSAVEQGKSAKAAAEYNQDIALANAKKAGQEAMAEAEQLRIQRRRTSGRQRAAMGASGLDLSGSFDDVYMDTAVQGELRALSRLYQGEVAAWSFQSEAELQDAAGKNALRSGKQQAWATALSSLGSAAASASTIPSFSKPGGGAPAGTTTTKHASYAPGYGPNTYGFLK